MARLYHEKYSFMTKTIIFTITLLIMFSVALPALAFPSLVPAACRGEAKITKGEGCDPECAPGSDSANCCCNLKAVEQVAVNIIQIILGITGSLALLMFVIGGATYLISGGNSKMLSKARSILTYAVIGLAIVLFSGALIKLLLSVLTGA